MRELKAVLITPAAPLDTAQIPAHVARNLAQAAHRAILRDWNEPTIRADYERWKAERSAKNRKEA